MTHVSPQQNNNWRTIFNLTVLSAYFYAFMEWLFFVTTPSSLSLLTPFEILKVLAVTCGIIAFIFIVGLILFSIPAWLIKDPKWRTRLSLLTHIPAALILAITALILFDNFTYTIFKFGIISTEGAWRAVYALGFAIVFWRMIRFSRQTTLPRGKFASILTLSLLAVSTAGILSVSFSSDTNISYFNINTPKPSASRPNIIIIGGDGLSDSYLSVYGYGHDTTPFLKQMAKTSLVAANAFPNVSSTTASTASVLTGREAITVGVFRYPDILSGNDSFEHLPGILKRQGYKTVEIGTPYYVDAGKLNLLDGFDIVNERSLNQPVLEALRAVLGNSPSTYFIQMIVERVRERLLHIFYIEEMKDPLKEVNNPGVRLSDEERVNQIIDLLDNADRPVFIFTHMMDTHGPVFSSKEQAASVELSGDEEWDETRYEEAIRNFDGSVKKIYNHLSETGQLDNTILVIYTDHGFKYVVNQRIPIIMHFPQDAHAGVRRNNVQIIDIPVTVLDYLGIPQPEWMTGASFLNEEPSPTRQIVSVTAGSPKKIAPPFYQIKIVQIIVCQKWYALNVQENTWRSGKISGHFIECDDTLMPPDKEVRQIILDYLEKYDYDISSLQNN